MAQTPEEFFTFWLNKGIDFDGRFGFQCMDVYQRYNKDVVGAPLVAVPYAIGVWNNYPTSFYDKVAKTADNYPPLGAVMVWGAPIGKYIENGVTKYTGHIAVNGKGSSKDGFVSMDQNWPLSEVIDANGNVVGTGVCHWQAHNYVGVLGWLVPKNLPSESTGDTINIMDPYEVSGIKLLEAYRTTRKQGPEGNWEGYANALIGNDKDRPGLDSTIADLRSQVATLQKQVFNLNAVLDTKDQAIKSMQEQISTLEEELKSGQPPVVVNEPVFTNPVAAFFYKMAKFAQG